MNKPHHAADARGERSTPRNEPPAPCQRCGAPGFSVELGSELATLCEYHFEALELEG